MDINTFFKKQNSKNQVKILTCGSVDDGKSTLIGRLLFDSKSIFHDQISQAEYESEKYGTQGKDIDLALLIDGLQAEMLKQEKDFDPVEKLPEQIDNELSNNEYTRAYIIRFAMQIC